MLGFFLYITLFHTILTDCVTPCICFYAILLNKFPLWIESRRLLFLLSEKLETLLKFITCQQRTYVNRTLWRLLSLCLTNSDTVRWTISLCNLEVYNSWPYLLQYLCDLLHIWVYLIIPFASNFEMDLRFFEIFTKLYRNILRKHYIWEGKTQASVTWNSTHTWWNKSRDWTQS